MWKEIRWNCYEELSIVERVSISYSKLNFYVRNKWFKFKIKVRDWGQSISKRRASSDLSKQTYKPYLDNILIFRRALEIGRGCFPTTTYSYYYPLEVIEFLKARAHIELMQEYFKNRYRNRYVRRI